MSEPIDGNHNDLYDIDFLFSKMISDLEESHISVDGLFLNADAGFDATIFRETCLSKGIIANINFKKRNAKTLIINLF